MWQRLLVFILASLPLWAWTADVVSGPASAPSQIRSRLLEVRVNGAVMPDFQEVLLGERQRVWLPLNGIVEFAEGRAERLGANWVYHLGPAVDALVIDPVKRKAWLGAVEHDLGERLIDTADSPMLEQSALQSLFGLSLRLRELEGYLDLLSERPLPRDLRILREQRWGRMGQTQQELGLAVHAVDLPYVAAQAAQADFNFGVNRSEKGQRSSQFDMSTAAEALYLTQRLFVAGVNGKPISTARWWAGRADPRGGILGLEALYALSAGDVAGQAMPMVGGLGSGRGIRVQAAPVVLTDSFSRTSVQGDAPPGWDAELYLEGMLRDYQRVAANGRFLFSNITVNYGSNHIRVVLYGPGGVTQVQEFNQSVSAGMVPPGRVYSWASLVQANRSVFGINEGSGNAGAPVYALRSDVGVSPYLTVSAQLGRVLSTDNRNEAEAPSELVQDYRGVEARLQAQDLGATLGTVNASNGRRSWYGSTYLPMGRSGLNVAVESAQAGFNSPYTGADSAGLKQRIRLSSTVPLGSGKNNLGAVVLSGERVALHDGSVTDTAQAIYAHSAGDFPVTHILELTRTYSGDAALGWSAPSGYYRLLSSYQEDLYLIRGELVAALQPAARLAQANVQAMYRRTDREFITGGLSLSPGSRPGLSAVWSRDFGRLVWSVSAASSASGFSIGTTLSFTAGYVANRGWNMSSGKQADAGAVELGVFRDSNLSGLQDQGEPGLSGLEFNVNGQTLEQRTDDDGRLVIRQLDPSGPTRIRVTRRYLEDDFLTTPMQDFLVWPRMGRMLQIGVPLVEAVAVNGYVNYRDSDGSLKGLGLATLTAYDEQGRLLAEVRSLSDGYFSFDNLYPGRWRLRATTRRLRSKGEELAVEQALSIGRGTDRLDGVNIVFETAGATAP